MSAIRKPEASGVDPEFAALDEAERQLLAKLYPSLKKKLTPAQSALNKSTKAKPAAPPKSTRIVLELSSDEEQEDKENNYRDASMLSENRDEKHHRRQVFLDDEAEESLRRGDETSDDCDEEEPSGISLNSESEDGCDMSIDRSYRPLQDEITPPRRGRQQPIRSAKADFMTPREPRNGQISPPRASNSRQSHASDDGEESFEKYLRRLKEEEARKKVKVYTVSSDEEEDEDEDEDMDSFIVSDEEEFTDASEGSDEMEESEHGEESIIELSDGESSSDSEPVQEIPKKSKNGVPPSKSDLRSKLLKSFESPSLQKYKKTDEAAHFLTSLSPYYDPAKQHKDAAYFIAKGVKTKKIRDELVKRIYDIYHKECFEGLLPDTLRVVFNARLLKTAGYCRYSSRSGLTRIDLAPKVCTTPERIRDTLVHEMCHAAVFTINKNSKCQPHGPEWKAWAYRCQRRFPTLPTISRCHSYKIEAKFVWDCQGCGQVIQRHSKSLDTVGKVCGVCRGRFVLREGDQPKREPNAFAQFVSVHYKNEKTPGKSHREVMQVLSAKFKASGSGKKREEEEEQLDMSIMSIHD